MPKFCMPTFGDGQNNSKTACICLYLVRFPTCIGKTGAILRAVNVRQTSCTTCRDSVRLWFAWRRSWHCASLVSPVPFVHATECCDGVGEGTRVCRFKSVPTWWLRVPISACATRYLQSPIREYRFVLLSMLSGEIYLRLKPHLVVKIFSDIVTEHCCQVYVLSSSMMFCSSDCRTCADMVSDCTIRKFLGVPCGLTPLQQANVGYEKYS